MTKKVLIVDDDSAILEATKIVLSTNDYQVKTLTSSKKIVEVIKKEKPDLILLDMWLQGEGGDTIAKNLKSQAGTKKIPIILMSANQDLKRVAKESKADNYIAKPFDIDALVNLINKHIG